MELIPPTSYKENASPSSTSSRFRDPDTHTSKTSNKTTEPTAALILPQHSLQIGHHAYNTPSLQLYLASHESLQPSYHCIMIIRRPSYYSYLLTQFLRLPFTAAESSHSPSSSSLLSNNLHRIQELLQLEQPTFAANMTRAPVISISHGGGPMPVLGDPGHASIVKSLRTKVPELLKLGTPEAPRAIVLVTAHWSESVPTISGARKHKLLYDYYGFPPESYKLKYEAEGSPEVAAEVAKALEGVGLKPKMDLARGMSRPPR